MIYSKIWTSQQVGHLSYRARLLYLGMITLADDDGRLIGDPAYLRGQVFPYDEISAEDMKSAKKEVEDSGLVHFYFIDNFEYAQHPKWEEYQAIRRDLYKKSTLPSRNGTVTKPLRRRNENVIQVKLSKDKISKAKDTTEQSSEAKDVSEVISLFKVVNPSYETLFSRNPQRQAASRLLKKYGMEKLRGMVGYLEHSNASKYAPTITTPYALEAKMGELKAWADKERSGKGKGIISSVE